MTLKITVDDAAEKRKRENIYQAAYDGTKSAIETKIEEEKEKTRNGKNGFWSKIFLAIAEFIDGLFNTNFFTGMLAKMNGTPIPEKQEIAKASEQVAKAVSDKLNDKTFTYANKQEFEAGISEAIKTNLTANKDALASFGEEQIARLASEGAAKAGKTFSAFFDDKGKAILQGEELSVTDAAAKKELTSNVRDSFAKMDPKYKTIMSEAFGKKDLQAADFDGFIDVLTPTMAGLELEKSKLTEKGDKAFSDISDQIRTRLIENKDYINMVGQLKLPESTLSVVADAITVEFAKNNLGLTELPKDFLAAMEGRKQAAIKDTATDVISGKISEQIKTSSAVGVLAVSEQSLSLDNLSIREAWARNSFEVLGGIPEDAIKTMKKYYTNDGKGNKPENYTRNATKDKGGELERAQQELNDYAAAHDSSLDENQRKKTSDTVAAAIVSTVSDPQHRYSTSGVLADSLQINIMNKLQGSIEGKDDLFQKIATQIADSVRANKDGTYTAIDGIRTEIGASRIRATGEKPNQEVGMGGGEHFELGHRVSPKAGIPGQEPNTGIDGVC